MGEGVLPRLSPIFMSIILTVDYELFWWHRAFFRGLISADLCWQEKLAESSLFVSIFSCFPCILVPSLPGETHCKVTNVKQILQHVYNI